MFLPPDNHDRALSDVKESWHRYLVSAETSSRKQIHKTVERSISLFLPLEVADNLWFQC